MERSAAAEVSRFMQSEFGLQAAASCASWTGESLTVTLTEALSPVGQITANSIGGGDLLATAYDALYDLHPGQIHALISQVMGLSVRQSSIALDVRMGSFLLTFFFAAH